MAALIPLVVAVFIAFNTEPAYQGRTLTSWVDELSPLSVYLSPASISLQVQVFVVTTRSPIDSNAVVAIRGMGTNAIPSLLNIVRHEDGRLKQKLVSLLRKQSFLPIKMSLASERHPRALRALAVLGPQAVPAWIEILTDKRLPDHIRQAAIILLGRQGRDARAAVPLIFETLITDEDCRITASESLLRIGPESVVPLLIKNLSATNILVRRKTLALLSEFGYGAKLAIPALLNGIEDPANAELRERFAIALRSSEPDNFLNSIRSLKYGPPTFRAGAASSLGLLKQKPEVSVPALIASLDDPYPPVRESSASSLADFGTKARDAVPKLLLLCNDPKFHVRRAATNALKKIDPPMAEAPH